MSVPVRSPHRCSRSLTIEAASYPIHEQVMTLMVPSDTVSHGTNALPLPGTDPVDSCWLEVTKLSSGVNANCLRDGKGKDVLSGNRTVINSTAPTPDLP
ncbi:hypothetical protein TNCV_1250041 [Trichonephila clavipes]|nr:hypothetical protein TNCV_1250041 [Trichonephila clavipes]